MIELYLAVSFVFAYITMSNLENLRTMPKKDIKSRGKFNEKIKDLEEDLNLFFFWPWLLFKKIRNEYNARK